MAGDQAPQYRRYDLSVFTLIPLHKPKDVKRLKGGKTKPVGKAPIDFDWTKRKYDSAKVLERCLEQGRNIGVRLKKDQLVIDVDPRNGGEAGFESLCADLGLDGDEWPRVYTGSGGFHCYLAKPSDVLILDTLEAYKGVEFKSAGRQVVAAGSIHPNGKPYFWSKAHPSIGKAGLKKIPTNLLNMINRPQRSAISGGGQYSQEQIAKALNALDPTEFRDHTAWLRLMMACHHASAGEARQEFVEWSASDPHYTDQADIVGRRWDSLHAERNDGITYRTLNKILSDNGASNLMAASDIGDDFEDSADDIDFDTPAEDDPDLSDEPLPGGKLNAKKKRISDDMTFESLDDEAEDDGVADEAEGGWPDASLSQLEKLNAKYVCTVEGGKFRILYRQAEPVLKRDYWVRMDASNFEKEHCNIKIQRDMTGLTRGAAKTIELGKAWLTWPRRKHVDLVVFDPGRVHEGCLNLWQGFAVEPLNKGSWHIMRELIFEVLSDGDEAVFNYILNWLAFMLKNPGQPAEVALVFMGGMGVGKGTLGNAIVRMVGQHAMSIASPEMLVGRFNRHFQDLIFLFADEAVKPWDKPAESRLKNLLTEPTISIEAKGVDAVTSPNYLHVMMATNDRWAIPAGMEGERRFMVSRANNKWQGMHERFQELNDQLYRQNGLRRMMFDLLNRELPARWHPRLFPVTDALITQKLFSLDPLPRFIFNCITEKALGFDHDGDWHSGPVKAFVQSFRLSFNGWCRENNIKSGSHGRASTTLFLEELKGLLPNAKIGQRMTPNDTQSEIEIAPSDGRAPSIELPSLSDCERSFEKLLGMPVNSLAKIGGKVVDTYDFG